MTRALWLALAAALALGVGACRNDEGNEATEAPDPAEAPTAELPLAAAAVVAPDRPREARPTASFTAHDVAELGGADLARVERLELAFSDTDWLGRPPDGRSQQERCAELDLLALSPKLPALIELRLSGCQTAAHTGLGALGDRLRRLELADLSLDGVTLGRLSQLVGLETLELTRVSATEDPLGPAAKIPVRTLILRELENNSPLIGLVALWPRGLRRLRLEGSWAAHESMLVVGKASNLEVLELFDTRVGNFSLNQAKKLLKLREVDFRGQTFNDNTPLYVRNLPMRRFACACPRIGDGGLRNMRFVKELREVSLTETRLTGSGLVHLGELEHLNRLSITGTPVNDEGLDAIASFARLRSLVLRGPARGSRHLPDLSQLTQLEELVLAYPDVDDQAAEGLAGLRRLRHLDLGGTAISDDGLIPVGKLAELRHLALHHTRVTNRGLAHLAKLYRLEVLELDHCDVLDAGVAHLAGLPALRELRLDNTLVTDAAVASLLGLPALERLNLANTVVSAAGAARLEQHPRLRSVNLQGTRVAQNERPE